MQKQYTARRSEAQTLILTGPAMLTVRRGKLLLEDGCGCLDTRRSLEFTPPLRLSGIVRIGKGGTWSDHALCLLAENSVPFYSVSQTGELNYSLLPPGGAFKPSLIRLQAQLQEIPFGLKLAKELIAEKVSGQQNTLSWLRGQMALPGLLEDRRPHSRDLELIERAETLDELRLVEARAADVYFSKWAGIPVRFERTPRGCVEVPEHWRSWPGRSSRKSGTNRDATDPINALLNFGYAIAAAEVMVACRAAALEPSLGVLHADKDGRASLIYDLLEPLRPQVDRHLLQLVTRRTFSLRREFILLAEGVCRIGIEFAAEVGKSVADLARPLAVEVVARFKKQLQGYSPVVEPGIREARNDREPLLTLSELPCPQNTVQASAETTPRGRQCCRCGGPTLSRRSKHCASCLHLRRREVVLANNEREWERRRVEGDPSHGGKATRKRSETLAERRALLAA